MENDGDSDTTMSEAIDAEEDEADEILSTQGTVVRSPRPPLSLEDPSAGIRRESHHTMESDDDDSFSSASSDLDNDDDIATQPRGPLIRRIMAKYTDPSGLVYIALSYHHNMQFAPQEAGEPSGRSLFNEFYMRDVPESERSYHVVEGNRMLFQSFDERSMFDRRVNERK